jgi:hypothetical protein
MRESNRLLSGFSCASAIGFAILDDHLRYVALNDALAAINGIPAEVHLHRTVREVFGEVAAATAEPAYEKVLASGQALQFEIADAVWAARSGAPYWGLNICFPIRNEAARVTRVGFIVVETTGQRKLEKLFRKVGAERCHTKTKGHTKTQGTFWVERELRDSIRQYHNALAMSLGCLITNCREPEKSAEVLAQSVEQLDTRITEMRALVSAVASRFPIDPQFERSHLLADRG